ncbi:penicillin-binding protein 1B [Aestuariibacter sp. AA17]|uniref:Penicillin-binding protein 1B n=1 Tax=Fluctibacter corallii TaxID=2984329 RepID=A0ABT3A6R4_9ALTE|nr:penicillin-binding protein 1B [Aestuariibacter sp. AA17]MCV2884348.1 penicillin-binding protein 1B [Aestuariibacter sp. AA17]
MANKAKSASKNPFKWLWRNKWKLGLALFTLFAVYLLYLNIIIQNRFEGNKWQVPAQIYARHLVLEPKQQMTAKEIKEELSLLNYRKVKKASNTGEYQQNGNSFIIMRRAFHFPDGFQREGGFNIVLENNRVKSIVSLATNTPISEFRMEPWLVTRLINSGREDRMLVSYGEVPQALKDALVLVEDRDFYQHHGVAPLSIARALMANIAAGKAVQGGSTLTQQLVKNLFLTREKTITRKINEALMALIIDARYTKEDILEAYINEVFLGQNGATGVHGFGLAAQFYFDRPLRELNTAEVATLVGMVKGPSFYNPRRNTARAEERRNLVLRILFEANKLSRQQFEHYVNTPLKVVNGKTLLSGKHPAFMDRVRRELSDILDNPDIRQSGVKVFTTLDTTAQRKAEKTVSQQLSRLEKAKKVEALEAAMVVTDIRSGEVRAIVGSKETQYSGFNRALDAKRSIGSLIKPAIYLTALEQAASYNLATPLRDQPIRLKSSKGAVWEPKNNDKAFRGQVPLYTALTRSLNVPTVSLGMELGLSTIVDSMRRLGVTSDIKSYPALTLGAVELAPIEVNQMYQTIANNGKLMPIHTVQTILSADNAPIWQFSSQGRQRFDEDAAYLLNYALHKVTLEGTAKSLSKRFPNVNMAGKTGTTDDYRDSWFSGFDNNLLITTWIGKDNNTPTGLTGTSGALALFSDFQSKQSPKSLVRRFPEGLGIAHFRVKDGMQTTAGCKGALSVPAILDALPLQTVPCDSAPPAQQKQKAKSWWERIFG